MNWIKIKFKDGTSREFKEVGRAGGSYTISIKYEGNFAIVVDEYGGTTAFPSADITEINTAPYNRSW